MAMIALGRPAWTGVVHGGLSTTEADSMEFHETKSIQSDSVLPFLETKDKQAIIKAKQSMLYVHSQ